MKKIYIFLALFLAMLGGSSQELKAQEVQEKVDVIDVRKKAKVTDLNSIAADTPIQVLIRNEHVNGTQLAQGNGYLYVSAADNNIRIARTQDVPDDVLAFMPFAESNCYLWEMTKDSNGKFTFKHISKSTPSSPLYIPVPEGLNVNGIAGHFTLSAHVNKKGGQFKVMSEGSPKAWDGNPYNLAYWAGDGHPYSFYTVDTIRTNLYTVTINAEDSEGRSIGTKTEKRVSGAKLGAFTFPFYTVDKMTESGTTTELTSNSVVEKNMTITATCIENPPFKTTTISNGEFANETHWYQLKMHLYDKIFCNYVSGQTQTNMTSDKGEKTDDYLWCFVGDVYNGFKIYNRQAGSTKPLSALGTVDDHKNLAYCTANTDDATSMWSICESNNTTGPCFKLKGTEKQYLNYHDRALKYWDTNDSGSTFMFVDVTTTSLTDAKNLLPSSGCVGGYSDADLSSLQPAVENYENAKTEANFTALRDACLGMNSKIVIPMKAGYYRVYGTRANNPGYLTYNTTANKIQGGHANLEAPYSQQIWKFEEAETGKYKISSGTTYIGAGNTPSDPADATSAGVYELVSKGIGGQALKNKNSKYLHSGGSAPGYQIVEYWNPGAAAPDGSIWYIKETTLLDVTISNVANGYATVSSTFPLMIPTGVKAYYANKKGAASLNLTEVTGDVIPANEGVVLYSDAAKTETTTYAFVGALTAGTPFASANLLSNTATGPETVGTQSTCYVLACPTTGVVGFYKAATTLQIPANKAYYQSNGGASLFSIIGGDEELTEIGGVVTDGETVTNGKAYNLNGTPASQLTKGGIYIINGKKVMK